MISTTYWMSSICLCCNCHSEVQVFSLSFYMGVNWSTEVKWSVDVATGPECKFRSLMLTPLVFVLCCTTLPTHTFKSFSFFLKNKQTKKQNKPPLLWPCYFFTVLSFSICFLSRFVHKKKYVLLFPLVLSSFQAGLHSWLCWNCSHELLSALDWIPTACTIF